MKRPVDKIIEILCLYYNLDPNNYVIEAANKALTQGYLDLEKSINSFSLIERDKLNCFDDASCSLIVKCKTLKGRKLEVRARPNERVNDLKVRIMRSEGIPVDQMRLILCGRQLEDDEYLTNCNGIYGGTVQVVLRLMG